MMETIALVFTSGTALIALCFDKMRDSKCTRLVCPCCELEREVQTVTKP